MFCKLVKQLKKSVMEMQKVLPWKFAKECLRILRNEAKCGGDIRMDVTSLQLEIKILAEVK